MEAEQAKKKIQEHYEKRIGRQHRFTRTNWIHQIKIMIDEAVEVEQFTAIKIFSYTLMPERFRNKNSLLLEIQKACNEKLME